MSRKKLFRVRFPNTTVSPVTYQTALSLLREGETIGQLLDRVFEEQAKEKEGEK